MKKIGILFVCVLFFYGSQAQKELGKHNLGLNAGYTTGLGLSYEYWPKKNGIQITFLPLLSKDEKRYSFALTYLRNLTTGNKVNLILFFGNHLTNIFETEGVAVLNYGNYNVTEKPKTIYNIGIGPGLRGGEGMFVYQFMIGYAIKDVLHDYETALAIEFGFFYNF
ncbi:MAG: hypothetical protein NTZ33_05295 [Bacteroidetes bacterium]|nr:hypothetical protein [Bacteroidota bacterium]